MPLCRSRDWITASCSTRSHPGHTKGGPRFHFPPAQTPNRVLEALKGWIWESSGDGKGPGASLSSPGSPFTPPGCPQPDLGVPKWYLHICPSQPGCHPVVVVGLWGCFRVFGVPVKLPLVPELEKNSAHPATISILLKKTAVLGWQRETRHRFKVKLHQLWPKN